jgi:NlpC/P60 family
MDEDARTECLCGLIGRPYANGADGPDAFDCYGLVRHVRTICYDDPSLPEIDREKHAKPDATNIARELARHLIRISQGGPQAWQATGKPTDGDIVVMGNIDGRDYHMGVYVRLCRSYAVIHTEEGSGVIIDDVPSLPLKGFHRITYYRRVT